MTTRQLPSSTNLRAACIQVSATRLGGIAASLSPLGGIGVAVSLMGGIRASAARIGGIAASAGRRGGIDVATSLVCAIGAGRYLRVVPKEAQWIDVDESVTYAVTANVDWTVV